MTCSTRVAGAETFNQVRRKAGGGKFCGGHMRLWWLKSVLSAPALRNVAISATCILLQFGSGHAQTLSSETSATRNEVLVFEQMRVPRWLAEAVVRAAGVTNVDPVYMMALADKESSLLPGNRNRTSSAEGLF